MSRWLTGKLQLHSAVSSRFVVITTLVLVLLRIIFVIRFALRSDIPLLQALDHFDSYWYSSIAAHGYREQSWAFFPLYPFLLSWSNWLIGTSWISAVGSVFSSLCFIIFAWIISACIRSDKPYVRRLAPQTRLGWILFLSLPGSYIFSTHHTESLFVLLVLLGLVFAYRSQWLLAACAAGLSALTRNQGVAVIVTVAFACAQISDAKYRWRVLFGALLIGGLFYSIYPAYQYLETGNPYMSVQAQLFWRPEMTASSYIKSLWFGNPWQVVNFENIIRYVYFLSLVIGGSYYALRNLTYAPVFYCLACIGLMPVSGEFVGAFRYGIALFPMMFWLGDQLAKSTRAIGALLVLGGVGYQFKLFSYYLHGIWSY